MSQPHGAGHGEAPLRACQSCCQVSGLTQVSGPGSEGCWWTRAACRQAGTGGGPVGWQCQSSPQECHMVSEPVSPWCPLLVSRSRHSRGSMGLRGEQGTFCPGQACSTVPAGHGDTHHPKASLPAGGIGLSLKEQAQMSPGHPMGLGSLSQSSPSLSRPHSGWEPLRISLPFGREVEATFRSHLFQEPRAVPWPGTWGCGGVPGSLTFPPLTCGSSCFAGAAGCVATLLHDAAMNPAEGNDGPGLLGRGESGSAKASWVPSIAQRVLLLLA